MKRIFFIHGDKGGVGKTQAATRTAAAFLASGVNVTLVDGDARNPGLYTLFDERPNPVHRCNVLKTEGLEDLFELIASAPGDILVDLPAGGSAATERMSSAGTSEGMIDLGLLAREVGAKIVVMFVMDQNRESIAALRDEMGAFPPEITEWVIVRNLYEDRPFRDLETSKTYQDFLARGGKEMEMVRLDPSVISDMARNRINLLQAAQDDAFSMIKKIRAKSALRLWMEELKKVGVIS